MPTIVRYGVKRPGPVFPKKFIGMPRESIKEYIHRAGNWRIAYFSGHGIGLRNLHLRGKLPAQAMWLAHEAMIERAQTRLRHVGQEVRERDDEDKGSIQKI